MWIMMKHQGWEEVVVSSGISGSFVLSGILYLLTACIFLE